MAQVTRFPLVKIVSDGTGRGTHIFDTRTGEEILSGAVTAISWHIDSGRRASRALLTLSYPAAEFEVSETHVTVGPQPILDDNPKGLSESP